MQGRQIKKETGSILAFVLMLMTVLIIVSIGIATSSIHDRNASMTNEKSNKAFQAANDGTEIVTRKVKKNSADSISSIGVCETDGAMTVDIGGGGKAVLSLYNDPVSGGKLDCNGPHTFAEVQRIKSVGQFAETSRAIEVAIAAAPTCWSDITSSTDSLKTACLYRSTFDNANKMLNWTYLNLSAAGTCGTGNALLMADYSSADSFWTCSNKRTIVNNSIASDDYIDAKLFECCSP